MATRHEGDSPRIFGYGASVDDACRVLVVGSMPSVRSLEVQEYYGHPQNRFWVFMQELFGIPRGEPHAKRLELLRAQGVALWDVVHACRRETSADAKIRDVEANDFVGLLREYPRIERVFCNGAKAHDLWRRLVAPRLATELDVELPCVRLPSTSPANASQSVERKLREWRGLAEAVA